MYHPELSDFKTTNFACLRDRAIQKMWLEPLVMWTMEERAQIDRLLKEEVATWRQSGNLPSGDWREISSVYLVHRDLNDLATALPKWASLAAWLAPEYALSGQPWLIEKICKLALPER